MVLNKLNPQKTQTPPQDLPKVLPNHERDQPKVKTKNTCSQCNSYVFKHFKLQNKNNNVVAKTEYHDIN